MPWATAPSTWPRQLHRVDDRAGIRRVHALQDHDFAGHPVDGDAEAMHVERDAARRAVRLAGETELHASLVGRGGEIGERHAHFAADDRVGVQTATVAMAPGYARGKAQDALAQGFRGQGHSLAGDKGARAGERAGVVAGAVGIGLDDAHPVRRRAEQRGDDLDVLRRRAVAELGGPDRQLVEAVVQQPDRRVRAMLGRRRGVVHGVGDALAGQPVAIIRRGDAVAASRAHP